MVDSSIFIPLQLDAELELDCVANLLQTDNLQEGDGDIDRNRDDGEVGVADSSDSGNNGKDMEFQVI